MSDREQSQPPEVQWTRSVVGYYEELARFAMARCNVQRDACRSFANCLNPGDAALWQWNFWYDAYTDYTSEVSKLLQFWMILAENALALGRFAPGRDRARQPVDRAGWNVAPSHRSSDAGPKAHESVGAVADTAAGGS